MNAADLDRLRVVRRGLAGVPEADLLRTFCEKLNAAGLPLSRGLALIDTLHPVHEGTVFRWRNDAVAEESTARYGPSTEGELAESWQRSPFFHLLQTGAEELRRRVGFGEAADFQVIEEARANGATDYVVFVHRFAAEATIGDMDCVYSSWVTRDPGGFSDGHMAALRRLVPALGLAIKSTSLARIAETLVETYLGRDAGRQVLEGRMTRGMVQKLHAVIWFSDMKGYTALSESIESDQLIPLLNDYAEAVIAAVHGAGGDVLKLIGDGVLATFTAESPAEACRAALVAEAELRARVLLLKERRTLENLPTADVYIGLHIGDVYYGNIGTKDRLDFTVIGSRRQSRLAVAGPHQGAGRPRLRVRRIQRRLPAPDEVARQTPPARRPRSGRNLHAPGLMGRAELGPLSDRTLLAMSESAEERRPRMTPSSA